jgi:hypothetical protein
MENITAEILQHGEYKIIELLGKKLLVFKSGTIYRWMKSNFWKLIETKNNSNGYNLIKVDNKLIRRHRIMAFTFLNLDINNSKQEVDHINGDKLNNHVDNLRLVNQQENCFNRTNTKGYSFRKARNKFESKIMLNGKSKHLGYFTTEEDAHQAYLNAKTIYHIIPDRK